MPQTTKPNIKAVLFDLGGVIIRTDDRQPRTVLAAKYGRTYEELDQIVWGTPLWSKAEQGLVTLEEAWEEIGQTLGLSAEELITFRAEFFGGDSMDMELIELIRRLRKRYRTGLLSNNWIADLDDFLQREYGISDLFDDVVSSAQVGLSKPHPQIYRTALERIGAKAEETVFVDDSINNIRGAEKVGIHAVRFFNTPRLAADLQTLLEIPD